MRIFDTHAHYDSSAFASDRDEILSALPQAGVELVVDPGCDVESSRASRARSVRFMNNANRLPNTKSSGLLTRFCGRRHDIQF